MPTPAHVARTRFRPWFIASAALLVGMLGGGLACERENASHCGNLSGDATCAAIDEARPFCSVCEAAYDGCVVERPKPSCRPTDQASSSGTGATSEESSSGIAMTGSGSGGAVSSDSGTTLATSTGPGDGATSTGGEPVCGDGVIEGPLEKCEPGDPPDLDGHSCAGFDLGGGDLACASDCRFDFTGCDSCGNDTVEAPEECDGRDLGASSECTEYNPDAYIGGPLSCRTNCTYDVSDCELCTSSGDPCETTAECYGSAVCGLVTKTCGLL